MIHKIARYRIREDDRQRVEDAITRFVAAVREQEPQTRYHAYRLEDGPEYVHLMEFPDAEAEGRHQAAEYTQTFVELLYPSCVEHPRFADLNSVGEIESSST